MARKVLLYFLLLTLIHTIAGYVSYDGYQVFEVHAKTESHNQLLLTLENHKDYDFWSKINKAGIPVQVMVAPESQQKFREHLSANNIHHDIIIPNVEDVVKSERQYHESLKPLPRGNVSFDQYLRHSEINDYLAQLAEEYPDLVRTEVVGRSYEGRNLTTITISTGPGLPGDPIKPVIFVDAGIHAREWIAPATALYIIQQLVENSTNRYLIENVDWVVLPSLNPDGYEYTFTNTRMWRKTRSHGYICDGVDANRNFDFHWMEANGASDNECAETYAGSVPFSDVESRILRNTIQSITNVKLYITLHSYGQYFLHGWGFTTTNPDNVNELQSVGLEAAAAIQAVDGTAYRVGSTIALLYPAAGITTDWAAGVAGVDLAYTIELPGGGSGGFDLPPARIRPVVQETFEGFKVLQRRVAAKYYKHV